MAIKIKSPSEIARKYVARAGQAGGDYKDGVLNPARPQNEASAAANETYKAAMQASLGADRFLKGVRDTPSDKWTRKASGVGAQRYPAGVAAAQADFEVGVTPALNVIAGLTLPEKFPRGDPRNNLRVNTVTEALRKMKIGA